MASRASQPQTEEPGRSHSEPLTSMTEALAYRLNRRGFLGTIGKGALLLAGALAGIAPIGANMKAALACVNCDGCRGDCRCGEDYSDCSANYIYEGGNGTVYVRRCTMWCPYYYYCCFAVMPRGYATITCLCQAYDCGT